MLALERVECRCLSLVDRLELWWVNQLNASHLTLLIIVSFSRYGFIKKKAGPTL